LESWGCLQKENRGERERRDCQIESFKVLVTVTLQFRRDRREVMLAEASDMQVCKNDAVWGPLSPQKPSTAPFWGPLNPQKPSTAPFWGPLNPQKPTRRRFWRLIFPPKGPTRHRFGTTFLIKAHTTPFWGQSFPPNFPRWTRPFFCLFWFLFGPAQFFVFFGFFSLK
jgi:hypothetical protein